MKIQSTLNTHLSKSLSLLSIDLEMDCINVNTWQFNISYTSCALVLYMLNEYPTHMKIVGLSVVCSLEKLCA